MFRFAFLLAVVDARDFCQEDDCLTHQVPHDCVSLLQTSVNIERLVHDDPTSITDTHKSLDAGVAGDDESLTGGGKSAADGECGHFSYVGGHVPSAAKVLVAVVTYSGHKEETKASHAFLQQRLSHARLQESFSVQYFSNAPVSGLPSWCDNHKTSDYMDAQERFLRMLYHIFNGCMKTRFDWLMQLDDDAVFDPRRLLSFVNQVESAAPDVENDPIVFSRDAVWSPHVPNNLPTVGKVNFTLSQSGPSEFSMLGLDANQGTRYAFGGNGILWSAASLRMLDKYAGEKWHNIYNANWNSTKYTKYFETRMFSLLSRLPFPCEDMFRYLQYGFGVNVSLSGSTDQVQELLKMEASPGMPWNNKSDQRLAAFTLHKVHNQTHLQLAAAIFDNPHACATVDCSSFYASILRGQHFPRCS